MPTLLLKICYTSLCCFFQTLSPSKRAAATDASADSIVDVVDITDDNFVAEKKKKIPRRVLHFSDGIIEEYRSLEQLCSATNLSLWLAR